MRHFRIHIYYLFGILFWFLSTPSLEAQQDSLSYSQILKNAREIRYQDPDAAVKILQSVHEQALQQGDTVSAVYALLEMPFSYGQGVNYSKSYDTLWHALFLADDSNNDVLRATIYGQLGRLYSFYKREEQAFEYLETAMNIKKKLVEAGTLDKAYLVDNYYLICATYRELDNPKMAKVYLDSCFINYAERPNILKRAYLDFENAFIQLKEKEYDKALDIMKGIEPWFLENRPSYLVLVYTYWGDIYSGQGDYATSEKKYQEALDFSDRYQSHKDFTSLIYERLTRLYRQKGDYKTAFEYQNIARELDERFFDSRSDNNRSLLEIKDEFRLEKERQQRLIQRQRLDQLEQEEKISFLQRTILLGSLIFLLIIGWIYVKQLRTRHKTEKQLIGRSKELEIKKAEELLELKNKELAVSALQLVEKDEFLRMLKDKLKDNGETIKASELKQVLRSISVSNDNNWEEFKLRFTAVNDKFYQKLIKKYPKLTQSDQKICALIKLNFTSKDMARLLGISVESVHTTRYRLRKKMGLTRNVNLEEFIGNM